MSSNPKSRTYKGQIAVVTGGGSGVGEVVAHRLAGAGVHTLLVGRTEPKLARVAQAIEAEGGAASFYVCDVSDPAQVEALRDHVLGAQGAPHILFNGAGLHCELTPIRQTTPALWIQTLTTNVVGPYLICRAFMQNMIDRGWGRIINVSSAASLGEPAHIGGVYQLSKVTLNQFTRQLAVEVAGTGVTANAIHPGEVKTEMWAAIKAEAERRAETGRRARGWAAMVEDSGGDPPEKAADLVMRILSPAYDDVNGQFLWIEDGIKAPMPTW